MFKIDVFSSKSQGVYHKKLFKINVREKEREREREREREIAALKSASAFQVPSSISRDEIMTVRVRWAGVLTSLLTDDYGTNCGNEYSRKR